MIFLFLLLLLPATAMGGNNPFQNLFNSFKRGMTDLSLLGSTPNALNNALLFTHVNVTNKSDKKASFVLSAIHTTQEKTNMYSKKYKAYLTQSVVTDPVEASPMQTVTVSINKVGVELAGAEKIFGLVIFAAQIDPVVHSTKKTCSDGKFLGYPDLSATPVADGIRVVETDTSNQPKKDSSGNEIIEGYITKAQLNALEMPSYAYDRGYLGTTSLHNRIVSAGVRVCQRYDYEIKFTEYTNTFMSNPKAKQITLKSAQNYFDFPQDFIFNAKTERSYFSPDAEEIIQTMRAVENKYNKAIFPPQYFQKEVIQQLAENQITHLIAYAQKLLREPIPIRLATLGTLLDCGKYNGIAAALVKIALAIVTLVVTGGATSFIMDAVDSGMNFSKEIKDAKMRG